MTRAVIRNRHLSTIVLITLVLIVTLTGFCALDGNGHHTSADRQFCFGMIAVTLVVFVLMTALVTTGPAVVSAPIFPVSAVRFVLTPPPEPAS